MAKGRGNSRAPEQSSLPCRHLPVWSTIANEHYGNTGESTMFFSKKIRCGQPEWDGQAFALDDPRIPPGIRLALAKIADTGDTVFFSDNDQGGEWWLLDANGELIEAFRQEA
jgi:hypothetical protein